MARDVLDWLLDDVPRAPGASFEEWAGANAALDTWRGAERCVAAGYLADRLGWAFLVAYRAALTRLHPTEGVVAALCVTEAGGNHPRAIRTTLTEVSGGYRLDGHKMWSTMAGSADQLLVVASVGEADGRNRLKTVVVPVSAVVLREMPQTPFVPEIGHFEVVLDGVEVEHSAVLEGDGYDRYVKPFRTVEDAHVCLAAAAYLLRLARDTGCDAVYGARLVALLAAGLEVVKADPGARVTHLRLGALLLELRALCDELDPSGLSADEAARWQRDLPILGVAGKARKLRLQRAWSPV